MDCREFRNKHVAYVDDLLPAFEMDAMQRHLFTCSNCARQDTKIRRSLLIVRNLPPIEPSPEFISRLNARLAELGPESRVDRVSSRASLNSVAFAALAAGIVAVAYLAVETNNYFAHPDDLRLGAASTASTMAMAPIPVLPELPKPARTPMPMNNAALVASVSTGIPIWPAALMAGQSPMHFASILASEEGR
jgi:hypothetical protein